jgi:hypothetical protein
LCIGIPGQNALTGGKTSIVDLEVFCCNVDGNDPASLDGLDLGSDQPGIDLIPAAGSFFL